MTDKKITYCNAIIECCKRAEGSPQKKELIRFIEDHLDFIYEHVEEEWMMEWTAEDWIMNIREKNSSIPDDCIWEFNNCFITHNVGNGFTEYANHIIDIPLYSHSGYYELCGVYWYHFRYNEETDEYGYHFECDEDGPTTNLEELREI